MNVLNDPRHLATVLAALRYWQREGLASAGHEQDIATDDGALEAMTADEIDALCEALNVAEAPVPAVVVEINGGMVNCVRANEPMRVVVLDADTEGGDPDNIFDVNGEEVYVHDYGLSEFGGPGQDGVDPAFVQDTIDQIEAA